MAHGNHEQAATPRTPTTSTPRAGGGADVLSHEPGATPEPSDRAADAALLSQPLRRKGERGGAQWEPVSWDEALADIATRVGRAIADGRRDEIVYHAERPAEPGFPERLLHAWGVPAHTEVRSAGARLGMSLWTGYDRSTADDTNAKVVLLLSSDLEAGHSVNPYAQRVAEGMDAGAKLVVLDPRRSDTAVYADMWLTPWPGSEAAVLLAVAAHLLATRRIDTDFVRRSFNWETYLAELHPEAPRDFETFLGRLTEDYAGYTFEFAAVEAQVPANRIEEIAELVANCGGRLAAHSWGAACAGNLGGWQAARALWFVLALTGSIGARGGTRPDGWHGLGVHQPDSCALKVGDRAFLLPHVLGEGEQRLDVYFSHAGSPLATDPDGFAWIEALSDVDKIGLHVALTPVWSETAEFADYVLPVGPGAEHDDRAFWTELAERADPDSSLGLREHVPAAAQESQPGPPARPGTAEGWPTPSGKLEVYSTAMRDRGLGDHATPGYLRSHVARREVQVEAGECVLVPTFQVPKRTRAADVTYFDKTSNSHPLWLHPLDAARRGMVTGDLVRVGTEIGHFVARLWVTEGIRPGLCALSHHLEHWHLSGTESGTPTGAVELTHPQGEDSWLLRQRAAAPFGSGGPDPSKITWEDPGVHQNLAFAVQPDPHSGAHCRFQKVRLDLAHPGDRYGDVFVETSRSAEVYRRWLERSS